MIKFMDDCMDSADWVEKVSGYRPAKDIITLKELSEISENEDLNGGICGLPNHWDYPLSEIPHLMEDSEDRGEMVLVRFGDEHGGYVYRLCEL